MDRQSFSFLWQEQLKEEVHVVHTWRVHSLTEEIQGSKSSSGCGSRNLRQLVQLHCIRKQRITVPGLGPLSSPSFWSRTKSTDGVTTFRVNFIFSCKSLALKTTFSEMPLVYPIKDSKSSQPDKSIDHHTANRN